MELGRAWRKRMELVGSLLFCDSRRSSTELTSAKWNSSEQGRGFLAWQSSVEFNGAIQSSADLAKLSGVLHRLVELDGARSPQFCNRCLDQASFLRTAASFLFIYRRLLFYHPIIWIAHSPRKQRI